MVPSEASGGGYPPATWRLIVDGEADGATNMAIDEAIVSAVADGTGPPTLRFFGWRPACLSLGRSQALMDVDLEACRAAGVDVVRRPTGGKAILHTDELTYSVILLQQDPRATGDVVESYRRLSEGLLAGLLSLGVDVAQAKKAPERTPSNNAVAHKQDRAPSVLDAVCFETPSDYEIVSRGRKLVGSAQWRVRGAVLQHGTLPLWGDITRIVEFLAFSDAERERQRRALRSRASTLAEALGRALSFAEGACALARGFSETLNLTFEPGELLASERLHARELRQGRYAALSWTGRM